MPSVKLTIAAVTLLATVSMTSAPTLMTTKNENCSKDFRRRMSLREEGNKRRRKGEERRMWKGRYVNKRYFFLS